MFGEMVIVLIVLGERDGAKGGCAGRVSMLGEKVCGEKERLWMCHERESVGLEYVWCGCACGGGG